MRASARTPMATSVQRGLLRAWKTWNATVKAALVPRAESRGQAALNHAA
jgi:hypothetical protein